MQPCLFCTINLTAVVAAWHSSPDVLGVTPQAEKLCPMETKQFYERRPRKPACKGCSTF